jgi:hypothetical protein
MAILSLGMSSKQPVVARKIFAAAWSGVFAALASLAAQPAGAQIAPRLDLGGSIEVGGEAERYLRALQIAGLAPMTSWAIQPFSPSETRAMRPTGEHPWRTLFDTTQANPRGPRLLRPKARLIENSAFPFEDGPGPTWSGRGITGELQWGGAAEWRSFSVQLAPLGFVTENSSFALAPNGQTGDRRFADARFPSSIDLPQRFGDKSYGRVTLGSSALTFDDHGVIAGLMNAPQRWGPAYDFPLVLSPNAGGFPEFFLGTSRPANVWIGRLHARVVYGKLGESAIEDTVFGQRDRLGSGLVLSFLPRGIPGLEIGGTRFIHRPWQNPFSKSLLERPFSGGLNVAGVATNILDENQVASVFGHWMLPVVRTDVYAELYREDFPGKFHQTFSLVEKPDDLASYTLGIQHVFSATGEKLRIVRAEIVNGEASHQEIGIRFNSVPPFAPIPPYIHTSVIQGHTLNGLALGSPDAYTGSGWRIALDDFSRNGRNSMTFERTLRLDFLPVGPAPVGLVHPDVLYALRLEALRSRGAHDVTLTLIPALDLNRNLVAGQNELNLYAAVTLRGWR